METWTLLSTLAVRTTGFPIELLERLRFTHTTAKVREILTCEADITDLRRRLSEESFPAAVKQAYSDQQGELLARFSTWRRAVSRQRIVEKLEALSLAGVYGDLWTLLVRWNT